MSAKSRGRCGAWRAWVGSGLVLTVTAAFLAPGLPARAATATPSFVQQASTFAARVASLAVTPTAAISNGDRLIVEVGIWNWGAPTTTAVTDAAGDTFTEVLHFKASDDTELSVWTAPITKGGGTRPAITAKVSATADVGMVALEYSGLSTVNDASVVDTSAHASGTTGSATTVSSGPTAAASGDNELALGLYADSGFDATLTVGSGWAARANMSPNGNMQLLAEDRIAAAANTPNATVGAGPNAIWLMATLLFEPAPSGTPTAPSAPSAVAASAGDGAATVTWTAPADNGSPITSYTVTPYVGTTPQTPATVTGSPLPTTATIGGLVNGTTYQFTVAATNAIGTGPASAPSNPVTPGTNAQGVWAPLTTWPLVAVHSVLLHNGKMLVWDGWDQPQPTDVWDPATNTFTTIDAPDSIFCAGNASLPDGRVLVVGGYGLGTTGQLGLKDTNIFDPATSTWTRVADMNLARWYPTLTELPDGRYVAISGNSSDANTWADTPEIYDPGTNKWSLLSGISTSQVHEEEYPFSYLAPNGKVFTIGPAEDLTFFLDPNAPSWTPVGSSGVTNGSSVMYRPGKILYSGGAASVITTTPAQANTSVIDLNAPTPTWRTTAPMGLARVYHTLTMLADGKVLAAGGEATSDQLNVTTGVLPTEIWDPATETWSQAAPIDAARNYHSTAVLLPDGTVLTAGGGHGENSTGPGQFSAQIYSPPYLFKGARPTITAAPGAGAYGSTMSISTPDATSISAVNLVSLGADTHQADMNQHFVPLSFTARSGAVDVQLPASAALAPPGTYMLFIVNGSGVPSVASMVDVTPNPPTVPGTPTAVVASAGNASAFVSWTAPASNGGSAITSYIVTPYIGSTAQPPTTVSGTPPATSATVTGLTNGTSYSFTVAATNGVGTGPESVPSAAVTPAVPPAPTVPVVDVKVSVNATGATATTPSFSTAQPNETLLAFTTTDGPASSGSQTSTVSGAGLNWTLAGRANTRYGTSEVWSATAATALSGVTVKATEGLTSFHQSLTVVAFKGSAGTGAVSVAGAASGGPTATLTTTRGSSLVYAAGNDWDGATARTPGTNQVLVNQWVDSGVGDTFWVQAFVGSAGPAGTAVTMNDTAPVNHQWNLIAVEVLSVTG